MQAVSTYAASKAAVEVLTKTAAKELGSKGIRVNAVAPGLIAKESGTIPPQEAQDYMKSLTPLENRLGTCEEVANVVTFLASMRASWVTGQVIRVDGAFS
jgi:3-oxoacyl-[acyl-carrier protein] reductase